MPLIVYLDETGDHSLVKIDKTFPVFGLVMLACEVSEYVNHIVPAVYQLKMDFFGHEGVVIHSRDIRKAQANFGFLTNLTLKQSFYERINALMSECNYVLFASVIHKQKYREKYGESAPDPYYMALMFALERLLFYLETSEQKEVTLIAEARGKNEDAGLRLGFLNLITSGTDYVHASRFKEFNFRLEFKPKIMNIVGTQLADLAAYPTARHVLKPDSPNPAYDIIENKFYQGSGGIHGLKIFP